MGIVLPDGILGNPGTEYIRWWILCHSWGKTALAYAIGRWLHERDRYKDGVWRQQMVELGLMIMISFYKNKEMPYCGAARGSTILGIAALRPASTIIGATSSTTLLVFESVAGLGGFFSSPLYFSSFTLYICSFFLFFRTYVLTENIRYVCGIFSASTFDFFTNESLPIHRRGAKHCAPTSLKQPLSLLIHMMFNLYSA